MRKVEVQGGRPLTVIDYGFSADRGRGFNCRGHFSTTPQHLRSQITKDASFIHQVGGQHDLRVCVRACSRGGAARGSAPAPCLVDRPAAATDRTVEPVEPVEPNLDRRQDTSSFGCSLFPAARQLGLAFTLKLPEVENLPASAKTYVFPLVHLPPVLRDSVFVLAVVPFNYRLVVSVTAESRCTR